ncbi:MULTISPECIES: hypothetical protein [unclassified Enterococcus]|uniref:hypothetical protein n=1 Tax=unclassified Enterococcus TaxID=2608891 RepID=UPI00155830E6|nr:MULTISPECIES: hypothetical protein [unclassified Enterococcus]MBS7576968.1 hypothetical protein [Enterococcus sp. MMGLQ5-2]MBS7584375.1 hypothetical protein [Enterococcus sp. MMGLQ5-1]NPD12230.1 hypothetical protein [Enterococcus sp. MMGLQ5-1]NPD36802.1 hypothetical protein [Enterococcus sp. MMGLQ5-2]
MDVSNLSNFLSSGFITLLAFAAIMLILKHWKEAAWIKILGVIIIALIIRDFAVNQGNTIFSILKWVFSLIGVNFT